MFIIHPRSAAKACIFCHRHRHHFAVCLFLKKVDSF